ncbi:MAG: transporter substrate-binding domain-containing protein [Synergistaceae bacterium]|nr:transporter substrate-binding domain-containing protein [Synergistaceae bacterium]
MKSRKFLSVVLVVCIISLFAGVVCADQIKMGVLAKLNMTSEEYHKAALSRDAKGDTAIFSSGSSEVVSRVFYDSLTALVMALNAGEVDEIALPQDVGEYVMNANDGFKLAAIVRTMPSYLAIGFRKDDDPALRNKFNEALLAMKADGTLAILRAKYIDEPGLDEPLPVKFEAYENVDAKIKVAVTGDLPPIDFIAADGTPAGFNTAVLAEIGKRLKINIELVNIESGARAAALASGRADAVFWIQYDKIEGIQADVPEGIALSEPYYNWNQMFGIRKK